MNETGDHNHDCTGCGGYWVCDLDDCDLDGVCVDCEVLFDARAAGTELRIDARCPSCGSNPDVDCICNMRNA